jgi:hypothetical protein
LVLPGWGLQQPGRKIEAEKKTNNTPHVGQPSSLCYLGTLRVFVVVKTTYRPQESDGGEDGELFYRYWLVILAARVLGTASPDTRRWVVMESLASLDLRLVDLYTQLKIERDLLHREKIAVAIREVQLELRLRRSFPKPWWLVHQGQK